MTDEERRDLVWVLRARVLYWYVQAKNNAGPTTLSWENACKLLSIADADSAVDRLYATKHLSAHLEKGNIDLSLRSGRLVMQPGAAQDVCPSDIKAVFEYWKSKAGKAESTRLTPKRKRAISARLSEGFNVGQLCAAVDAMLADEFYHPRNPSAPRHDDIELVCRTPDKVEHFLERTRKRNQAQSIRDRIRTLGGNGR